MNYHRTGPTNPMLNCGPTEREERASAEREERARWDQAADHCPMA